MMRKALLVLLLLVTAHPLAAADYGMAFGVPVGRLVDQPDKWFSTEQGKATVDNIITWQNENGGWWKAYDASNPRPPKVDNRPNSGPQGDDDDVWHKVSTIDNNATYSELRILARAARVLNDEKYKASFNRGLKFLFDAQFDNGGWPQRFPLQDNYGRHITFNDDAMLGVMKLMRDIFTKQPDFAFVSDADREHAKKSFDKGIECILNCQIKRGDKLTVWCQQHDEKTLAPANARAYELPSMCAAESAGLTDLLMDLENPGPRERAAIEAAVDWFNENKITGKRVQRITAEGGRDTIVVNDPTARVLWARFYDLETGKPFFCGRDGIKRDSLDQIPRERRAGYAWYGSWGDQVLKEYPKWKARVAQN